ncbi:MAG: crossover junction endodeoxyribonuclease RuvC [Coriobacteriia bacterium]|nr:crossover junction endodeoxyribonuclease RuvC [Coriobacteriia bacterium]
MIILGIDPGLANTGWGVVEVEGNRFRCLGHGCITTASTRETAERLKAVRDQLASLIALYSPLEAALENVYFSTNVRSAMATGQARGAALVAVADAGLPVGEYGPGEIKLAVTGHGSADKRQVTYMVRAVLGMREAPKPDHAADALAVAICHANCRVARARARDLRTAAAK